MADKIVVPDEALTLWKQVLCLGVVTVDEEEVSEPESDVWILKRAGLVLIVDGSGPSGKKMILKDESLRLTDLDIEALSFLKGKGQVMGGFYAWARAKNIKLPLDFLKKLTDLDLVRPVLDKTPPTLASR